jgi:copper transport protein
MALAVRADGTCGHTARWLSAAGLASLGVSLAVTGHAGTADPQWLTRSAVFIHATTVAFWTGALVPLVLLLRSGTPAALAPLRRFSRLVPLTIAALIFAGLRVAPASDGLFLWSRLSRKGRAACRAVYSRRLQSLAADT